MGEKGSLKIQKLQTNVQFKSYIKENKISVINDPSEIERPPVEAQYFFVDADQTKRL